MHGDSSTCSPAARASTAPESNMELALPSPGIVQTSIFCSAHTDKVRPPAPRGCDHDSCKGTTMQPEMCRV